MFIVGYNQGRELLQLATTIASAQELIDSFEKIYAPHCLSNWLETRYILLQFIKENITHLGAITHLFSRDEYQNDKGNCPHQHLILAVDYSHLGIEEQDKILEFGVCVFIDCNISNPVIVKSCWSSQNNLR